MGKQTIISALDVGSSSIKMLVAKKKKKEQGFELLSQKKVPSSGVRRGVVVDVEKVGGIISSLKKEIEEEIGQRIDEVFANIGGSHLFAVPSRGLVSVSRADQKISEEDVKRVLQASRTISLSSNKEIIDVFPRNFIVDGEGGIKEPVGMQGVRLEADVLALCGFSPYVRNSHQAILGAGFQSAVLVPTPLASASAVLTPREKELGVCVLDIGAGTTSFAVFEEDNLLHAAVFPVGSASITNDLAICLKIDVDIAERIKTEFGTCVSSIALKQKKIVKKKGKSKTKEEKIKIPSSSLKENDFPEETDIVFSKNKLKKVITARVIEIFNLAKKELKNISKQKSLPAGIVLTGGGAKMPGIRDLAKRQFELPCRIGAPLFSSNSREDLDLSVVYGLLTLAQDSEEDSGGTGGGIFRKIKKIFKVFIP